MEFRPPQDGTAENSCKLQKLVFSAAKASKLLTSKHLHPKQPLRTRASRLISWTETQV